MAGAKHSQHQLDQVAAITRPGQPIQAKSDQECFAPTARNVGQAYQDLVTRLGVTWRSLLRFADQEHRE